ncbi:MAG TPA: hypothetical protein VGL63_02185 [Streptosporangiaceae bacterium]
MAAPDDAADVLAAFRLGWYLAEVRGRNRPGSPPGAMAPMLSHTDHTLPLRIERSRTELRIEAQEVVCQLAKDLKVDAADDGSSLGAALDDQARALAYARVPAVAEVLQNTLSLLERGASGQGGGYQQASQALEMAVRRQRGVVTKTQREVTCDKQAVTTARARVTAAPSWDSTARTKAEDDLAAAGRRLRRAQAALDGEQAGIKLLNETLMQLVPATAVTPAAGIQSGQNALAGAVRKPWGQLAGLIWKFDAHVQDRLTATSEKQACGYQLGRGLAETYWALDPGQADGWTFLLGEDRCAELARLTGRLADYMDDYSAPAIAGSLEVWREVAATADWRVRDNDAGEAARQALYRQIRRWYELIVLGQDPTTLIKPYGLMRNYRTVFRAVRLFWPQFATAFLGLLVVLIVLPKIGHAHAWAQSLSAILAALGFSLAGLTGFLKNSAQAMTKRLRQDTYTELVAIAVQTAPPLVKQAPRILILIGRRRSEAILRRMGERRLKAKARRAIARRELTAATPN